MRFESPAAYRDLWRRHPALTRWTPAVERYVDHDLIDTGTGTGPTWRSKVSAAAVREDTVDLLRGDALSEAWTRLRHEAVFLRAERGMLDQPQPLYPDPARLAATEPGRAVPVHTVPGTNHYTIVLDDLGATAVAAALARG